jgi:hypothetical protein
LSDNSYFDPISSELELLKKKSTVLDYKDLSKNFLYEYLQKSTKCKQKFSEISSENLICIKKNSKFNTNKKYDLREITKELWLKQNLNNNKIK